MSGSVFVGREVELEKLKALFGKKKPTLVVIKGRRRAGKSTLVHEFAKNATMQTYWSFAGLAPQDGVDAQQQRDSFAHQLSLILKSGPRRFTDWSDALEFLSEYINSGDVILFDEISWMGSKDPTFIPKLKVWWDKQVKHIMVVLCGSVSTWIEDNILNSTAFFGRVNLTVCLEPLSIKQSVQLLQKGGMQLSDYDTYKLLSIVGGIPWYLEQLNPSITADENIKQLCFCKNGLLVTEFNRIFNDLFNGKGSAYKKILNSLKDGAKTLSDIKKDIGNVHNEALGKMVEHLIVADFVSKQPLWSFKTAMLLKQSLYRISDPYMRFYCKVIEPNMHIIEEGGFDEVPLSTTPGFETHLGLQLEILLLQNRHLLIKKLGICPVDVVRSGPYRQLKTTTQKGCQIDYLIQTKTNTLFICEFNFKRREISTEIITEMKEKLARLMVPKGFAKVPVLFHLSGVVPAVATDSYFYRIVDIVDFFEDAR